MRVSPHTARADDNPFSLGGSHGETLIPVSAFILPVLLSVQVVCRVDVRIGFIAYLHMAFALHILRAGQLIIVGTEYPFPPTYWVPVPIRNPFLTFVIMFTHRPSEQCLEYERIQIGKRT